MGTHYLPRNVKGEGRILFIFSPKALIYTCIAGGLGFVVYSILGAIGLGTVGMVLGVALAGIGFAIGTFKVPKVNAKAFRDIGGEKIDDVIKRYIKFQKKKNTIYVYKEAKEKEEN